MGLRGPPPASVGFWKLDPKAPIPKYATSHSACFDLTYWPGNRRTVEGFNQTNGKVVREVDRLGQIALMPGDRLSIPTSLIFDIAIGCSVRLHPRSGLSFLNGVVLANAEGIIDADYVEEVMILLHNISQVRFIIKPGDRLCQGEVVRKQGFTLYECIERPQPKSEREGGFGSTGTSSGEEKE